MPETGGGEEAAGDGAVRDAGWARAALDLEGQAGLPAPLGATPTGDGRCRFVVWAPRAGRVDVLLPETGRCEALAPGRRGYFAAELEGIPAGTRYRLRLDGDREAPDPASRSQPDGVHGASAVVDPEFPWTDAGWSGIPSERLVLYELHVGTFTREGTFDAVIPHLPRLASLGVTVLELMPVAEFPGARNWGYDGVFPFAAQSTYGGADGLRRLVEAAHAHGLAVFLDVVYNHLGPEGAPHPQFAPYLTDRFSTPWGRALNFDGPESDEVRRYFLENALWWIDACRLDGLRLDATDQILDTAARPFLAELAAVVRGRARALSRRVQLVAEDHRNAPFLVRRPERGGWGLDAAWNDDFHHALHALLTGEKGGYYVDFGEPDHLAEAFRLGWVFRGRRSEYRGRRRGAEASDLAARRFVVFAQNHDQVGNRSDPRRLADLVSPAAARLASAATLLSPFIPLLFMGEEYADPAPFPYFTSHGDPGLAAAVREGRKRELAGFRWDADPPDPQAEATFRSAVLEPTLAEEPGIHAGTWAWYRRLLELRREEPALARLRRPPATVWRAPGRPVLLVERRGGRSAVVVVWNFGRRGERLVLPFPSGRWEKALDSTARVWETGAPDDVPAPAGREGSGPASSGGGPAGAAGVPGDGGGALPETVDATREVEMELPPLCCGVWIPERPGGGKPRAGSADPPAGGAGPPATAPGGAAP